jgi:hypothetical protein
MSSKIVNIQEIKSQHACCSHVLWCKTFERLSNRPSLPRLSFDLCVLKRTFKYRSNRSGEPSSNKHPPLNSSRTRNCVDHFFRIHVCKGYLICCKLEGPKYNTSKERRYPTLIEASDSLCGPQCSNGFYVGGIKPFLYLHFSFNCIKWMSHNRISSSKYASGKQLNKGLFCFTATSITSLHV